MKHATFILALSCLVISLVTPIPVAAQVQPASASPRELNLSVSTSQVWTDTGLDLVPGDVVQITAAPVDASAAAGTSTCDPRGMSGVATRGSLPLSLAPAGALIAKLHPQGGLPLLVGLQKEINVAEQGHLYLGVNNGSQPTCQGTFAVRVQVTSATTASALSNSPVSTPTANIKSKLAAAAQVWLSGQLGTSNPPVATAGTENSAVASGTGSSSTNAANAAPVKLAVSTSPLAANLRQGIDSLPRRVNDKFKNLGDMVNFIIIGSKSDLQAALQAANWNVADISNTEAVAKAVLMTYEKKDYLQMPMSQLYLFGRIQDFGYEQAEPYAVVASRHHFRLWKAPFQFEGKDVWVGAGTHDIGFEKDQRNGSVTHKIDPAVDGERDHIGDSLQKAGRVKSLTYYLPPDPIQEARNATGGGYRSDGRILVITIGDEKAASAKP